MAGKYSVSGRRERVPWEYSGSSSLSQRESRVQQMKKSGAVSGWLWVSLVKEEKENKRILGSGRSRRQKRNLNFLSAKPGMPFPPTPNDTVSLPTLGF